MSLGSSKKDCRDGTEVRGFSANEQRGPIRSKTGNAEKEAGVAVLNFMVSLKIRSVVTPGERKQQTPPELSAPVTGRIRANSQPETIMAQGSVPEARSRAGRALQAMAHVRDGPQDGKGRNAHDIENRSRL